jgi:integrase
MRQKARKLTREFIDHAPDGNWPDTQATGLSVQVTNNGRGKSWTYEYTSPTEFAEKDGVRKYKRRTIGLGSVRAVKGGLSLSEARDKATQLTKQVRNDGIDPIEAAKAAKLEHEAKRGELMTVNDAMDAYYESVIQHKSFTYRTKNKLFLDRIRNGLGSVQIKVLTENPQFIVDKLGMRERWHDHRDQEDQLLFHLRSAIELVRGRCKIDRNPAVVKGCLQYHGLTLQRTKPKGRYKALAFKDQGRLIQRIQGHVTPSTSTHYPAGVRTTLGYLLEFIERSGARPGEVRQMQYKELDEDNKVWLAPIDHIKPVKGGASQRAVRLTEGLRAIIDAVRPRRFDQSGDAYVFPSPLPKANGKRGEPYADGTISQYLNKLWTEFRINPHGARTTLWMWARYNGYDTDLIDRQQGRRVNGVGATHYSSVGRAYLEDETLDARGEIMEVWDRFCDQVDPPGARSKSQNRS